MSALSGRLMLSVNESTKASSRKLPDCRGTPVAGITSWLPIEDSDFHVDETSRGGCNLSLEKVSQRAQRRVTKSTCGYIKFHRPSEDAARIAIHRSVVDATTLILPNVLNDSARTKRWKIGKRF